MKWDRAIRRIADRFAVVTLLIMVVSPIDRAAAQSGASEAKARSEQLKQAVGQQATLTRSNGVQIQGKVVSISGSEVTINSRGQAMKFAARDVRSIQFPNGSLFYDAKAKQLTWGDEPAGTPSRPDSPFPAGSRPTAGSGASLAAAGGMISVAVEAPAKWSDRIGDLTSGEIGDLRPGKFAVLIIQGTPYYCALDKLAPPKAQQNLPVVPFNEGAIAIAPIDIRDLKAGLDERTMCTAGGKPTLGSNSISGLGRNGQLGLLLIKQDGTSIRPRFFQFTGDTIKFNLDDDPIGTPTRRDLPLADFAFLLLPPGFGQSQSDVNGPNVPRRFALAYERDKQRFVAKFLVSETEIAGRSNDDSPGLLAWIRYFDEAPGLNPDTPGRISAVPARLTIGSVLDHDAVEIAEMDPSGGIIYRVLDPNPKERSADPRRPSAKEYLPRLITHRACPGLVYEIGLFDGSRFRYSLEHQAFVHVAESPMPVTLQELVSLDADTIGAYEQVTRGIVVPDALRGIDWKDLTAEDKIFFQNNEPRDRWTIPGRNRRKHVDFTTVLRDAADREIQLQHTWSAVVHVSRKVAMRALFTSGNEDYFHTLGSLRNRFSKQQSVGWTDLTDEERRLFHGLSLERARGIASWQERDRNAKVTGVVILSLAAAYKLWVDPKIKELVNRSAGSASGSQGTTAGKKSETKDRRLSAVLMLANTNKAVPDNTEVIISNLSNSPLVLSEKRYTKLGQFSIQVPLTGGGFSPGRDPEVAIYVRRSPTVQTKIWEGTLKPGAKGKVTKDEITLDYSVD